LLPRIGLNVAIVPRRLRHDDRAELIIIAARALRDQGSKVVSGAPYARGVLAKCLTSWRKTVVGGCRDSDNVVATRREMFGRDAVASYFRWHTGIPVLSTDVKPVIPTVGIAPMASS